VGGTNSPGTGTGIVVQAGNASACCAACVALGPLLCDAWVFDTDGYASNANCWPILGITGSKQGMTDRILGINFDVPCAPQLDTAAAASQPSAGFEGGLPTADAPQCCVLCGTLGSAACAAWAYNSTAGTCFPLASWAGGMVPAPGLTFGIAQSRPAVLAAGVQGQITALPPLFRSTWWLSGSLTGLNDAVNHYGEALRGVAGLERLPRAEDPMRNLLSYWSDNGGGRSSQAVVGVEDGGSGGCGTRAFKFQPFCTRPSWSAPRWSAGAFYYDGYWPLFFDNVSNTAEDVFKALAAYHESLGLTVGGYQMDPWWYGGSW
jgi:hypothetical protein